MSTQRNLVLGIDCGTTACKAVVWDLHGTPLAYGRADIDLLMPRPAWHEQDARQWWSATASAVRQAVAQIDARRLAALGITHQRETFVLVDERGLPLRQAIVWMDERARTLVPTLSRQVGQARFHRLTGKPLSGNLSVTKLRWLKDNAPHDLASAYKILDVHAFLVYCLTGHFRTGWGCADPMGLFDMPHNAWAADLLRIAGVRLQQMPDAVAPGELIGSVSAQAAEQCGLPAGLPLAAGLGDGQAAGLGAGVVEPGMAYLNLGTAVVSGSYAPAYVTDRAFRTMYGGVPGSFSLETVVLGGAYTVSWFVRQFAQEAQGQPGAGAEAMDAECRDIPPGAHGLLLVPYWNSAMNPYWDASASGIVVGWRGVHGRAHLYRAILEGIALEQRLHTEGVEAALGQSVRGFVVMGGGSRSALWRQIIADVTGKRVVRCTTPEAAALGAGILAASACGLYASVREAAARMTRREPDIVEANKQRYDFYTRLYEDVYRRLFPALRSSLRRLAETAEESSAS